MKKAILGLSTIVLIACSKVPITTASDQSQFYFNPPKEQIITLITDFKKSADRTAQGLKTMDSTDKPLSEAIWTIEGALNYDNAHQFQLYDNIYQDTLTITVSNIGTTPDGEIIIEGNSLEYAYLNLQSSIAALANQNEDIEIIDIELFDTQQYISTFKVYVTIGEPLVITPDYVHTDDDWQAGYDYGKCDGTMPGMDAADRITEILNYNIANGFVLNFYGASNQTQSVVYTNVETYIDGNEFGPSDYSNFLGQPDDPVKLISNPGHTKPGNYCVTDYEMTIQVNNAWQLASAIRPATPNDPIDKDIILLKVADEQIYYYMTRHHMAYVSFGIPVLTP